MRLLSSVLAVLVSSWAMDLALALPDGFEDELMFNLPKRPTDLTFTPQGQMIIVQKDGVVTVHDSPGGDYSFTEQTVALDISDKVCQNKEQGLVSVQVHPDFESNRYVFLYYTYKKGGVCEGDKENGHVHRLSRFKMSESNIIDEDSEEVWFETPRLDRGIHTGGKIEFGKDGHLYVTVGNGGSGDTSQDTQNLLGTIVRLTADGDIPPDNPFVQDANSVRCNENGETPSDSGNDAKCQEIFAIGLRNPFRFAMNPNTEGDKVHFYVNDVGKNTWEEVSEGGGTYS